MTEKDMIYMVWFQAHGRMVYDCTFATRSLAEAYVFGQTFPKIYSIEEEPLLTSLLDA
jgi:hypothetical protein